MPIQRSPWTHLARRNLVEHPYRLAASLAGVGFAVVLMFLEAGFRQALLDNMVAVVRHLDGDLFITHRDRYILSQPVAFPARRLARIKSVHGVRSVHPFYLEVSPSTRWRDPQTGLSRLIRVLAYRPDDVLLDFPAAKAEAAPWLRPDTALVDQYSKEGVYGPIRVGDVSELAGRTVSVVGTIALGTDFRANGTLLMTEDNLLRYAPYRLSSRWEDRLIDVGVVRLASGQNPSAAKAAVQDNLPPDCIVLTRDELIRKEQHFWQRVTPIGAVFDIGVVMGFIVGLAICYQVLATEIHDRLPQFATLKAMGVSNSTLASVVVLQGVYLSILAFVIGTGVSLVLYQWLHTITGLNMDMSVPLAVVVFVLTLAMCIASALLATRPLRRVDPAELFG